MSKFFAAAAVMVIFAGVVTAQPKQKEADKGEFKTVEDVVKTVPPNMYPKTQKDWTDIKLDAVNDVLKEKVRDQTGTFTVTVGAVENKKDHPEDHRLVVTAKEAKLGQTPVNLWFWFDDSMKKQLASLNPGDVVTIKGKMVRPRFERRYGAVCLSIDSERCEVVPAK